MSKKEISNNAFLRQSTITSAKFGSDCYSVGESAFQECILLSEINSDNVIENIGSFAFASTKLSTATFNNLIMLHSGAFNGCSYLEHINIPNYINIPNAAFQGCESLKEIDISNTTSIGEESFDGCKSLSYINIPNCGIIGKSAFKNCINLKKVNNNSDSVNTTIEDYAFQNCSNLNNILFENCSSIGNGAFISCIGLDEINFNVCKSIGEYAFSGCSNITQISLSMCSIIGSNAFYNCTKLDRVYIYNSSCTLGNSNAFCTCGESQSSNCTIKFYFNASEYHIYKENPTWQHYINNMIMMVKSDQIIYTTIDKTQVNINDDIANLISKNEYYENSNYGILEFKNTIESLNQQIFKEKKTLSSIDIPSECKTIGEREFEGCENLTNITISKVLECIEDYAFKNCKSFTSFEIPNSVTKLGEGVFAGCENIKKFKGNFVTYDGRAIVYDGKLICVLPIDDSITEGRIHKISEIDLGINTLGKSCFHGCVNMRRVDIPSTVYNINDNAFEGCINLCEIHFEGDVPPTLGENVFKGVREDFKIFVPESQLQAYNDKWSEYEYSSHIYPIVKDDSIIYYGDQLNNINNQVFINLDPKYKNGQYYKISKVGSTIPEGFFGSFADGEYANKSTTKVILGEGIVKINKEVFKHFDNMEYIYIPDTINELGDRCFYRCYKLKRIHIPSGLKKNISYYMNNSTSTTMSSNNTQNSPKVNFKNSPAKTFISSVTFGHSIFEGCRYLKEFGSYYKGYVSEDNRCYMDKNSSLLFFAGGSDDGGIKEYTIPDYITEINRTAFAGSHLTTITLNESIKTIGEGAFSGCQQLTTIKGWDNVETISKNAFWCCYGLSKISLPKNLKTIGDYAFRSCKKMYMNTNIPDSVTSIGSCAFLDCKIFKYIDENTNEQGVLNLNNITSIEQNTFDGCTELTKVKIGDKVTSIGYRAFTGCTLLKSVYISETSNLYKINERAFADCGDLTELNLPDKLTYIGYLAFENCSNYKGNYIESMQQHILTIPSEVTILGHSCFKNTGIEELRIYPDSKLNSIPEYAFFECTQLKSTKMIDAPSINNIGTQAFAGCNQLYNLELPNGLSRINDEAFAGCSSLLSVTLPPNLKYIGDCCFKTETSATSIYIPSSLATPPLFTIDNKDDSLTNPVSNPFGDISILTPDGIPRIIIPSSIANTYRRNLQWRKYNGKISVKTEVETKYHTSLSFINSNCPKNISYSISANGYNIASVNGSSSKGTIIEQTYDVNPVSIAVVISSNTSGEEKTLKVNWTGGNGTAIYSPANGTVQVPNGSQGKSVSLILKRNENANCGGAVVIQIN